jgi:tetratricopeptide (TPR) repeat protein
MSIAAFIASIVLMLPFLAWGIHTLRERYVRHEEISRQTELLSLIGALLFIAFELALVRVWMGDVSVFFAFTALGLVAASTALYGPIFVSYMSRTAVDLIHPQDDRPADEPRFTTAEALESQGDCEAALREYMVIARIFPKDSETAFRVAHVLNELDRYDEAAASFERGLRLATDPERAVLAVNRLADLYRDQLDRPSDAERALRTFLDRFEGSPQAELVQRRVDRLARTAAQAGEIAELDPSASAQS